MKTITVRLPERLAAQIEAESRERGLSRSEVIRERLERMDDSDATIPFAAIVDLVGSVEGPADLSANKKEYLRRTSYGRKRGR